MRYCLSFIVLLALPCVAAAQTDPNRYLEDIHGAKAMTQVKAWNTRSLKTLEAEPGYAAYRKRALDLLQDDRQIAEPDQVIGNRVLNLRRDKTNPRGLWRIASLPAFAVGKPEWRTLIDIDALGKREGKSWVWKGADCRTPDYARCLVRLSDGGGDADVEREFDVASGKFVTDGFTLPTAKSDTGWAGRDAIYVATDFGAGSLTSSGLPRIVKLWRRGTPLSAAVTIAEAEPNDVSITVRTLSEGETRYPRARAADRFLPCGLQPHRTRRASRSLTPSVGCGHQRGPWAAA